MNYDLSDFPHLSLFAPDKLLFPFSAWGRSSYDSIGCFHFYQYDHNFEPLFPHPERIFKFSPAMSCELNFSMGNQDPFPLALYQIWRKRFVSRYWQSCGLPVIVDLNVPKKWLSLALSGVPRGFRAFSTSASFKELDLLKDHWDLACSHSDNFLFLCYGGGKGAKDFCESVGAYWIDREVNYVKNQ